MALVKAPLLSLSASGAIGDALVFSTWKGRAYVRSLVKPANPKTGGQIGVRSAFKFLSQIWSDLGDTEQGTWEELADAASVAPFNSFMKYNLLRNRNFLAPVQSYPAAEALTADTIDTFSATAGERQITIDVSALNVETDNWGILLYRGLVTAFTPAFDNLIAVIHCESGVTAAFVDTPLVPDEYFYDAKAFTIDGVCSALKGEISDTVV